MLQKEIQTDFNLTFIGDFIFFFFKETLLSLLLKKYVVVCALGFAAMTIVINVNLHDFWNVYEGINAEREAQNFFKNLGIFAGLLSLAAIHMEESR